MKIVRLARTVGRECQSRPSSGRREKQQAVNDDAAFGALGQRDKSFGRNVGKDVSEQAARDVVPMECPGILRGDRIGEDRPVAEHLQFETRLRRRQRYRGADAGGDDKALARIAAPAEFRFGRHGAIGRCRSIECSGLWPFLRNGHRANEPGEYRPIGVAEIGGYADREKCHANTRQPIRRCRARRHPPAYCAGARQTGTPPTLSSSHVPGRNSGVGLSASFNALTAIRRGFRQK